MRKIGTLMAGVVLAVVFASSVSGAVGGPRTTYLASDVATNADGSAVTVVSDNVAANTFIVQAQALTDSNAIECAITDDSGVLATGASENGEFRTTISVGPVTVTEAAATVLRLVCYDNDGYAGTVYATTAGALSPVLPRATYLTIFK